MACLSQTSAGSSISMPQKSQLAIAPLVRGLAQIRKIAPLSSDLAAIREVPEHDLGLVLRIAADTGRRRDVDRSRTPTPAAARTAHRDLSHSAPSSEAWLWRASRE